MSIKKHYRLFTANSAIYPVTTPFANMPTTTSSIPMLTWISFSTLFSSAFFPFGVNIIAFNGEKACEAVMEQLGFVMNEAEAIDAKSFAAEPSGSSVKAHTCKRRPGSVEDLLPEGVAGRSGGASSK